MSFLVGRIGFEPMKAQGQLIYSQPRLTTSLPARAIFQALLEPPGRIELPPTVYKTVVLPLN